MSLQWTPDTQGHRVNVVRKLEFKPIVRFFLWNITESGTCYRSKVFTPFSQIVEIIVRYITQSLPQYPSVMRDMTQIVTPLNSPLMFHNYSLLLYFGSCYTRKAETPANSYDLYPFGIKVQEVLYQKMKVLNYILLSAQLSINYFFTREAKRLTLLKKIWITTTRDCISKEVPVGSVVEGPCRSISSYEILEFVK